MADLRVSYDTLEESARHLKAIQRELDDTKHHQGDIRDILGSHDMAHAMHDFAGNWDYHRHKLLDKIQAMGELTESAMETFTKVDRKLKDGITEGSQKHEKA